MKSSQDVSVGYSPWGMFQINSLHNKGCGRVWYYKISHFVFQKFSFSIFFRVKSLCTHSKINKRKLVVIESRNIYYKSKLLFVVVIQFKLLISQRRILNIILQMYTQEKVCYKFLLKFCLRTNTVDFLCTNPKEKI